MPLFGGKPNIDNLRSKRDVPRLIKAVAYQKDERVRRAAIVALGELKDARAVEPLIGALADETAWIRVAAVTALGAIGDKRAVEAVAALADDKAGEVWKAVIRALPQLGEPARATELLRARLESSDREIRKDALDLAKQLADPTLAPQVAAMLGDADTKIRRSAIDVLVALDKTRATEGLVALLRDTSPAVREEALKALERLGWRPSDDRQRAMRLLILGKWDEGQLDELIQLGSSAAEVLAGYLGDPLWDDALPEEDITSMPFLAALQLNVMLSALRLIGDSRAVEPILARLATIDREANKVASAMYSYVSKVRVQGAIAGYMLGRTDPSAIKAEREKGSQEARNFVVEFVGMLTRLWDTARETLRDLADGSNVKALIAATDDPHTAPLACGALEAVLTLHRDEILAEDRDAIANLGTVTQSVITGVSSYGSITYEKKELDCTDLKLLAAQTTPSRRSEEGGQ